MHVDGSNFPTEIVIKVGTPPHEYVRLKMLGATGWVLVALATTAAAIENSTTSNPSRYVQAPIIRDGTPNDPMTGYYWINLGFGHFTVPVIVDTGNLLANIL